MKGGCSDPNLQAHPEGDVPQVVVEDVPVEISQLGAQTHSVVSLSYRAALRRMGVAEQASHHYAVVDASDVCGVWSQAHLRALLRALINVGGYGGVLCVDLPTGCADTVVKEEGAHQDSVLQPDSAGAGQVRFIE